MQALATPEQITTARIRSLGVRLRSSVDRGGADEVLRVDARARGRRFRHHQRQVLLLRIALDAAMNARQQKPLGTQIAMVDASRMASGSVSLGD